MNPEYKHVRFLANPPRGGFPIRFGVVTACNPNGIDTGEAQNLAATANLHRQLQNMGLVFFPVTGCSQNLAHREPGFGVVCHTAEEVVELGRAWQQEAVFWVEDGIVNLLPCDMGQRAVVGAWASMAQLG